MDTELSPEQEALRDAVRRLLADRAPVAWVRALADDDVGTTPEVWQGMVDLGLTSLLVPPDLGGAGARIEDLTVAAMELGRAVHPGPVLSGTVAGLAVDCLGSAAQRRAWLPAVADGSLRVALALSGADRGRWDEPLGRAEPDGEEWAVTGDAAWVADAVAADLVLVTAHDPDGRLGLFGVLSGAPGVTITPSASVDLTRRFGVVALRQTPAVRLIPEGQDAGTTVDEGLRAIVDVALLAEVADGVGAAELALDVAVAYACDRRQFGVPIGSFQAVQHLCADMLRAVELARSSVWYGAWAADQWRSAGPWWGPAARQAGAELNRAAVVAKAGASDALAEVGASAIQVLGGIGFTWEHDAHLPYKRLLTLQHHLGGRDAHLEDLATLLLT